MVLVESKSMDYCLYFLNGVFSYLSLIVGLQEHWDHLCTTYGSGFLISRFVSALVSPVGAFFLSTTPSFRLDTEISCC